MIETHVVNALLLPELRDQPFFAVLTFVNGLVAPSFLFCAGFALAISLSRKWEQFTAPTKPFQKYVVRLLFILVVGYALHIPKFSLRQMMALDDESAWVGFFQADILHVISLTLLGLVLLVMIVRTQKPFLAVSACVALALVGTAPFLRGMDLSNLPIWIRPYLTTQFKSQFPLFPWSSFLIGGMLVGWWYLESRRRDRVSNMVRSLALGAWLVVVLALIVEATPITVYPAHNFWNASPEFFFVRFGIISLICAGLWLYEKYSPPSGKSVIAIFGQESLLVYVVHLLIVYGHTFEWSFIRVFGKTLNYMECLSLFAGLTLAMFVLASVWHRIKGWNRSAAAWIQYAVIALIVVRFIAN